MFGFFGLAFVVGNIIRKQHLELRATSVAKVVFDSLFPQGFQDRVLEEVNDSSHFSKKDHFMSILEDESTELGNSRPIADFFPETVSSP